MTKQRTFDQTLRLAKHVGEKLEAIAKHMPDTKPYRSEEWARKVLAIGGTLDIIASTPNASIGPDVLAAFDNQIDMGIRSLNAWAELFVLPRDSVVSQVD